MQKYESSRNWTAGCAERCLSGAGWSWWETHCRKTEMGALLRSAFWSLNVPDDQPCDLVSQCHVKKVMHRGWAYFQARLAFTMAAFNVLVQWHGLRPTASGFVPLSIAEFSL